MILVPRQLARAGMTGNVPYYGGRFTPAQAYAASHPRQAAVRPPAPPPAPSPVPAPAPPPSPPSPEQQAAQLKALQQLRDDGVINAAEHVRLASRVTG